MSSPESAGRCARSHCHSRWCDISRESALSCGRQHAALHPHPWRAAQFGRPLGDQHGGLRRCPREDHLCVWQQDSLLLSTPTAVWYAGVSVLWEIGEDIRVVLELCVMPMFWLVRIWGAILDVIIESPCKNVLPVLTAASHFYKKLPVLLCLYEHSCVYAYF